MLEYFSGSTTFVKGLFVAVFCMAGVFIVLIIFYFLIKALTKLFPDKS